MDRLPYDIWHIIFQLACTDGGTTGCALALTSRSCRKLSAATRLYSVSLHNLLHIRTFLVCLERIRASNGASAETRVQHLLLSFLPNRCDAPIRDWRERWTDYARDERAMLLQLVNDHRQWEVKKTAWNRAFVVCVSRLFEVVGDTLRTLIVLHSREIRLPLVRYHFPVLRELTLYGDDRLFVRPPPPGIRLPGESDHSDFNMYGVPLPSPDAPEGVPFPALKRLHVVFAFPKLHPWEKTLPQWAVLAPAVTHLRVSQGNAQVPQILRDMLGLPPLIAPGPGSPPLLIPQDQTDSGEDSADSLERERAALAPVPAYPSLRLVFVQLCRPAKWISDATADALTALGREVEQIATSCDEDGRSQAWISVLRSRLYEPEYWPQRLTWEWQDRMSGGDGCWAEDEYDEDEGRGDVVGQLPKVSALLPLADPERDPVSQGARKHSLHTPPLLPHCPTVNQSNMLHPMDRLPVDIWDHILSYACTDGGRTGAALAATSSGLRAASAAHRFHSLKLTSLAQIGRLLLCLDRIERSQSPHGGTPGHSSLDTRHLLLSFFPEDCESLMRPWRGWGEYSSNKGKREKQVAEDERAWWAAKGAWDRQFAYLVPRLFALVAPSLRTLVILQHPDIALPYVSVTLLADDGIFVRPTPRWMNRRIDYDHHDLPPFPLLTHLHVVFEGGKQHSWAKTLPFWAELAPSMTRLRVSQASNLITEVLEAMSTSSFPHASSTPEFRAALAHPQLQKIIIQPLTLEPVRGYDHLEGRHILANASRGPG
ncbi:hypothetical protein BV20DRAFT_993824 [Pilatotrama ljubarskyi]|nr:hypothetical protein BV20DRAFT_993824 [Pilatotrama ljubarskyi]